MTIRAAKQRISSFGGLTRSGTGAKVPMVLNEERRNKYAHAMHGEKRM